MNTFGGKFKAQTLPGFAFAYVGGWLETEVSEYLEEGVIKHKEIYAMRAPVISDIVKTLENTDMTDPELSAIIEEIDNGATSSSRCSQDDFDRISEARHMVTENICRCFVIPKGSANKTLAKDFLAYLMSDRAQKIAAQNSNGISVLPYGYTPTDEDMGFKISAFTKSVAAITNIDTVKIVDSAQLDKPFKKEDRLKSNLNTEIYFSPRNKVTDADMLIAIGNHMHVNYEKFLPENDRKLKK